MASQRRKSTFNNATSTDGGVASTSSSSGPTSARLSTSITSKVGGVGAGSGVTTSITDRLGLIVDDFDIGDTMEEKELRELERKLNDEVEEDLFEEPKRFNTLHRVIDVLGLQMIDDAATTTPNSTHMGNKGRNLNNIEKNPAYQNLRTQQQIVEGAIEHMAVIHCADLNGSVIQVGRVARQFSDAVTKVRHLRKQVRDIQDTLGANEASDTLNSNKDNTTTTNSKRNSTSSGPTNAAAMSLRELWLKKLECEAVLTLLDRLDVIRDAPSQFDYYISTPPCRIGAATVTLTRALSAMFSDDIAQVQALHKIMEQLLLRKQVAEEIVWDTMADVLYLRTGNGLFVVQQQNRRHNNNNGNKNNELMSSSGQSVGSESRRSRASTLNRYNRNNNNTNITNAGITKHMSGSTSVTSTILTSGIVNPFVGHTTKWNSTGIAVLSPTTTTAGIGANPSNDNDVDNDDDASYDSNYSGASLFSIDDDYENNMDDDYDEQNTVSNETKKSMISETSSFVQQKRMMIPIPIVEAELDLEADERRCLEEIALSGMITSTMANTATSSTSNNNSLIRQHNHHRLLPRYADPILALRILVECLTQLGRCDDAERYVLDGLSREIRQLIQREQARTFQRLERKQNRAFMSNNNSNNPNATTTTTIRFNTNSTRSNTNVESLKDFRRHLTGLLSAFGCVLVRMAHLAEVLRIRIVSYVLLIYSSSLKFNWGDFIGKIFYSYTYPYFVVGGISVSIFFTEFGS
jgi:hypothetical protein